VLLIGLWVRSYYCFDYGGTGIVDDAGFLVESAQGAVATIYHGNLQETLSWPSWCLESLPADPGDRATGDQRESATDGFRLQTLGHRFRIVVPHWFVILAVALIGSAPWIHLRFSLRTLLIATTLIAFLLGLVVWSSR